MILYTISHAWISDYYNTGTELTGWSGSDHARLHTLHTDPAHFEEVGPRDVWLASATKEVDCSWVMSQSCWLLSWSAFLIFTLYTRNFREEWIYGKHNVIPYIHILELQQYMNLLIYHNITVIYHCFRGYQFENLSKKASSLSCFLCWIYCNDSKNLFHAFLTLTFPSASAC